MVWGSQDIFDPKKYTRMMCQQLSDRCILQDVAKIECKLASTHQDQHGRALTSYPRSWTAGWFAQNQMILRFSKCNQTLRILSSRCFQWFFVQATSSHGFQFAILTIKAPFQCVETQDIRSALQAGQRVPDPLVSWAETCSCNLTWELMQTLKWRNLRVLIWISLWI